jgi:hypothetical protein
LGGIEKKQGLLRMQYESNCPSRSMFHVPTL